MYISWSAILYHQATKLSKKYEEAGGEYENEAGSKNEPTKGTPKAKSQATKDEELKNNDQSSDKDKDKNKKDNSGEEKEAEEEEEVKSEKKAAPKKTGGESRPAKAPPKKGKKPPATGTRKSARIGDKRAASEVEVHEGDEEEEIEDNRKTNKRATKK